MKPYRMKHIDSGLYYKPCGKGGSSLTETGKIYTTRKNGIECWSSDVHIVVNKKNKILSMNCMNKYDWKESVVDKNRIFCNMNKSEFIKEEL